MNSNALVCIPCLPCWGPSSGTRNWPSAAFAPHHAASRGQALMYAQAVSTPCGTGRGPRANLAAGGPGLLRSHALKERFHGLQALRRKVPRGGLQARPPRQLRGSAHRPAIARTRGRPQLRTPGADGCSVPRSRADAEDTVAAADQRPLSGKPLPPARCSHSGAGRHLVNRHGLFPLPWPGSPQHPALLQPMPRAAAKLQPGRAG